MENRFTTNNEPLARAIRGGLEGVKAQNGRTIPLLRKYEGGQYTVTTDWLDQIRTIQLNSNDFASKESRVELSRALKYMGRLEAIYLNAESDIQSWLVAMLIDMGRDEVNIWEDFRLTHEGRKHKEIRRLLGHIKTGSVTNARGAMENGGKDIDQIK